MLNQSKTAPNKNDSKLQSPRGDDLYFRPLPEWFISQLSHGASIEYTSRFRDVVDQFGTFGGQTPPGFRLEANTEGRIVNIDLVRDIGYDRGSIPRPTPLLFSADSANPYEVAECAPLIANVTCNPGIVYDLFINNPVANPGREFSTLEEVLSELGNSAGPGCDISVEIQDPFADFDEILEEVAKYEEILTRHRLVVKVPHTGPISRETASDLMNGEGRFRSRYNEGRPKDFLRGHALAAKLTEAGYRVNFTLMFEPYQTPLALQVRPYFINAFIRHRHGATKKIVGYLSAYDATEDESFLEDLRTFLISNDYLAPSDNGLDLLSVMNIGREFVRQRGKDSDGLDSVRESLRWLTTSNLPDSRLIVCSMEGDQVFPELMSLLTTAEFLPLHHRMLITADPKYLARWTSSPHVIGYQRRFLRAVQSAEQ